MNDVTNSIAQVAGANLDTTTEAVAGESKAAAFRRLAIPRTNAVLDKLRILGNLSSSAYEYTPEQVDKIEAAIRSTVDNVINQFRGKSEPDKFDL